MVTLDDLKDKLASNARLIGLDLGTKHIGIAICLSLYTHLTLPTMIRV